MRMKKIISVLLVLVISFLLTSVALAANVCVQISGHSEAERKFTVETKNRPVLYEKITLTQNGKGTFEYRPAIGTGTKTKTAYMPYTVYYKRSGDKNWSSKKWTDKSCTLTLEKYSTYTVRVVPYTATQLNRHFKGSKTKLKRSTSWQVTKTKGVDLCS